MWARSSASEFTSKRTLPFFKSKLIIPPFFRKLESSPTSSVLDLVISPITPATLAFSEPPKKSKVHERVSEGELSAFTARLRVAIDLWFKVVRSMATKSSFPPSTQNTIGELDAGTASGGHSASFAKLYK